MQASQLQAFIATPWATSAGVGNIQYPIPATSPGVPGRASFALGFPPETMLDPAGGGVPPFGEDHNGIMFTVTAILQAQQAGYFAKYNSAVSSALGGYWSGCVLRAADNKGLWLSTADDNVTNPDAAGAGWIALGIRTVFGRTGPAITAQPGDYSSSQLGYILNVSGTSWERQSPDGWLEKGGVLSSTTGTDAITFGTAFPTVCLGVAVDENSPGLSNSNCNAGGWTTTGFTIYAQSSGRSVVWRAWGK